jgi:putative FmdB family regulatory protein
VPTYEYECRDCGHRFEVVQSIKDPALSTCERCGGGVRRLISGGAGLLFKGSGFHLTDYRSDAYKRRARQEGGEAKPGAGAAGGEGGGGKGGDPAGGSGTGTPVGKDKPTPAGAKPDGGAGKGGD